MNIKRKIFEFIADHHTRWNQPVSIAQVRRHYGALCEDVDLHLWQLEREGLLVLDSLQGSAEPTPAFAAASCVHVLGNLPANGVENGDAATLGNTVLLDLSRLGIRQEKNLHGFLITDGSMTDAGFRPGDFVVIKEGGFDRGDLVLVTEDGHLALRRYLVLSGIPHFLAENSERPDLRLALEVPVHGVFWGLLRIGMTDRDQVIQPPRSVNYLVDGMIEVRRKPRKTSVTKSTTHPLRLEPVAPASRQKGPQQKNVPKQGTSKKTARKKVTCNWPAAPSGIQLNDRNGPTYGSGSAQLEDELPDRPYAADHFEALEHFCRKRDRA